MNIKSKGKRVIVTGAIAFSMIAGAAGGSIISGNLASAQTTPVASTVAAVTPVPQTTGSTDNSVSNTQPSGTFHSNENAAHEATESPAREAQENAGQRPTVQ